MKNILENLSKKQKILIVLAILGALLIIFYLIYNYFYSNDEMVFENTNSAQGVDEKWNSISQKSYAKTNGKIVVDVAGEVNNPGVVTLDEGARIIDAINAAGGETEHADTSYINLAYILEDGVRLYIPNYDEVKDSLAENKIDNESIKNESIMSDPGGQSIIQDDVTLAKSQNSKQSKVNINKASMEELKTLPGVGDTVAKAIIDYRDKNGKFKNIEDLKNVNGIGNSKFNNLKDLITIS